MMGEEQVRDRGRWQDELEKQKKESADEEERRRSVELVRGLREHLKGTPGPPEAQLPMSLVLRARARLNPGKATGPDGISAEVVRSMSWRSVRAFQRLFF